MTSYYTCYRIYGGVVVVVVVVHSSDCVTLNTTAAISLQPHVLSEYMLNTSQSTHGCVDCTPLPDFFFFI